jgi:hypothetical protein
MVDYREFIASKLAMRPPSGLTGDRALPDSLFPHQSALVRWALRRGRCAIFADTGLGKSRMEVAWADVVARETGRPVLILAPLAVAPQTVAEGESLGVDVTLCRDGVDIRPGVNITNYDRLHRFDPSIFGGVVLDESSVIKHADTKTFSRLTDAFRFTPFRLAATATPAPNDWTELGTHAEFLGICTQQEMLAEYFMHDGGDTSVWRLKRHARKAFWQWVVSWGALVRSPADLGFDGSAYNLPPLLVHEHTTETELPTYGQLFASEAQTLSERRQARRLSIDDRIRMCSELVNASTEPWVVWCDLNDESERLTAAIDGAIEVRGADDADTKERRLADFASGRARVLVSKASICGWGLNWQHAAHMAFVGVTDSFESYYQAVRRCWRFGQTRPVNVHLFTSQAEGAVLANLKRKEVAAREMSDSLGAETRDAVMAEVAGSHRMTNQYHGKPVSIPEWMQ